MYGVGSVQIPMRGDYLIVPLNEQKMNIRIGKVEPHYLVDVLKNSTKLSTNEGISTT